MTSGNLKTRNYKSSSIRTYYWVLGKDAGKKVIMGAYSNWESADRDGYANFQNYEVIPLKTFSRPEASRMIRKLILDETHDVEETFERFSHMERKDNGGE